MVEVRPKTIILLANTSWYLYNFRLKLIEKLISNNYNVILIAPKDSYTNMLKEKSIKFIKWDLDRRSINPVKELYSLISLIILYKRISPDIIHNFTMKGCLYGGVAARVSTKSKVINHITGLGPTFFNNNRILKLINLLIRPIYKFAFNSNLTKVFFHNKADQAILQKLGLCSKNNSVIINGSGVDTDYFSPLTEKKQANQPLQLLFPARVIKEKGFLELLTACNALWDDGFDFILNIAGTLDKGNRSSLTSKELDLITQSAKNIIFHGKASFIRKLYYKADIVVLPSWREGLSLSLIESSSMGLPIITTDVPGCREIVEDKVSGLIVPAKESIKLKEAIKSLILNMDIAISYGEKARKNAINKYSIDIINDIIFKVYNEYI